MNDDKGQFWNGNNTHDLSKYDMIAYEHAEVEKTDHPLSAKALSILN